jgi:hypothetical protein
MGDKWRLAATAAALAVLTACGTTPKTPATPAPTVPAPPASTETSTAPSTVAAAPLVLGPAGLGALTLGMTRQQAEATGLVNPFRHADATNCQWSTTFVGAPATTTTAGTVLASEASGVAAIFAYGPVGTPERIKLGSTHADVSNAYPSASLKGSAAHGNVVAEVPGNNAASYRFELQDGTVSEVALVLNTQSCEE